MSETDKGTFQFTIHMESNEYGPEESEWQDECRDFFNSMVKEIEEGELKPVERPSREGEKADLLLLFNEIVAYGVSIGAFSAIYQLAKLWLEQRSRCDIVLKFPDGSEMKMRGLSEREAGEKMQEHQQRCAQDKEET